MLALPVFVYQLPNMVQSCVAASAATTSIIKIQSRENHPILKYSNTMLIALNDNSDIPPIVPITAKFTVDTLTKPKNHDTSDKSANPYSSPSLLYIQQKKANETTGFNGVNSV